MDAFASLVSKRSILYSYLNMNTIKQNSHQNDATSHQMSILQYIIFIDKLSNNLQRLITKAEQLAGNTPQGIR